MLEAAEHDLDAVALSVEGLVPAVAVDAAMAEHLEMLDAAGRSVDHHQGARTPLVLSFTAT
ncbi:hypothetical protein [Falsiroseomonas bella]|uniref:hypothetical protein n=1 Tax=Falsiroseomonas bella TaxID=2184016 RepID=UPI0011B5652B|nr:hypothetical protein [Falsiroseomonas bella]